MDSKVEINVSYNVPKDNCRECQFYDIATSEYRGNLQLCTLFGRILDTAFCGNSEQRLFKAVRCEMCKNNEVINSKVTNQTKSDK